MLTLAALESIVAKAREKGLGDSVEVKFCAGNAGVSANAKISLNAAANIVAGSFIETDTTETVLDSPELVLNQ